MSDDDDLMFPLDEVERWKGGQMARVELESRKDVLLARCEAQSAALRRLLSTANPTLVSRLNQPL
jgi:hypothetical protein